MVTAVCHPETSRSIGLMLRLARMLFECEGPLRRESLGHVGGRYLDDMKSY